jgi:hypothetical protein
VAEMMPTPPSPPSPPTMAQQFSSGYDFGRGGPQLSLGLQAQSQRWNELAPHGYRPESVLNQIGLSPVAQNASAPDMADRYNAWSGTVLPNLQTGASPESAETAMKLRFMGDDEI